MHPKKILLSLALACAAPGAHAVDDLSKYAAQWGTVCAPVYGGFMQCWRVPAAPPGVVPDFRSALPAGPFFPMAMPMAPGAFPMAPMPRPPYPYMAFMPAFPPPVYPAPMPRMPMPVMPPAMFLPAPVATAPLVPATAAAVAPTATPASAPTAPIAATIAAAMPLAAATPIPERLDTAKPSQAAAPQPAGDEAVVHFEFDMATLTDAGKAELDALAASVKTRKAVVDIRGYADRLGPPTYNDKLSARRARAVQAYLAKRLPKGIPIHHRALGERSPVTACEGDATPEVIACLAPDRRAEVRIVSARKVLAARR